MVDYLKLYLIRETKPAGPVGNFGVTTHFNFAEQFSKGKHMAKLKITKAKIHSLTLEIDATEAHLIAAFCGSLEGDGEFREASNRLFAELDPIVSTYVKGYASDILERTPILKEEKCLK